MTTKQSQGVSMQVRLYFTELQLVCKLYVACINNRMALLYTGKDICSVKCGPKGLLGSSFRPLYNQIVCPIRQPGLGSGLAGFQLEALMSLN